MTRSLRTAWHRRRTAVLLATATVAASFGWALAPGPSSSAQTANPPFTIEVSRTTGLLDGDLVDVTVRADPGARIEPDAQNDLFICRPGVTYTSAADLAATAGNCPVLRERVELVRGVGPALHPGRRIASRRGHRCRRRDRRVVARVRASQRHARVRPDGTVPARREGGNIGGRWPRDRPLRHLRPHVHDARPDCRVRKQESRGRFDGGVGPDAGVVGPLDAGAVQLGGVVGCVDVLRPDGRGRGPCRVRRRYPRSGVHGRGVSTDQRARPGIAADPGLHASGIERGRHRRHGRAARQR